MEKWVARYNVARYNGLEQLHVQVLLTLEFE